MRYPSALAFLLVALPVSAQAPTSVVWEQIGAGLGVDVPAPTEADSLLLVASLQASELVRGVDAALQGQAPEWEWVARHNLAFVSVNTHLAVAVFAAAVASATESKSCRDAQKRLVEFGLMGASEKASEIARALGTRSPGGGALEAAFLEHVSASRASIATALAAWSEGVGDE